MSAPVGPAGGMLRRMLANSGWLLSANGVTGVAGVAQAVLLTRALGVQGYGILTIVMTVALVTNRLTSFRMNEFAVKYISDAIEGARLDAAAAAIKFAVLIEVAASLLAFGLVVVLAPLASTWFVHHPDGTYLVRIAGLTVLATVISETSQGVLHAFDRFRAQAAASAAGAVLSLAAVATAAVLGGGLTAMVLALVIGMLGTSLLLGGAAFRRVAHECGRSWWRVPLRALDGSPRRALGFAASTNASATLSLVARDADPLWLGFFRGPTEVAYYRLGLQLATYLMLPVAQFGQAFYPEIARRAARNDWLQFRRLLRQGTTLAAAYLVPGAVLAVVLADPLVRMLYGEAFAPATPVLMVLLVGMGFANLLFWSRPALLAIGRPDYPLKVNVGVAALKLAGVFIVIPAHGYIGNAVLLAMLYIFGVGLSAGKVWREMNHRVTEAV